MNAAKFRAAGLAFGIFVSAYIYFVDTSGAADAAASCAKGYRSYGGNLTNQYTNQGIQGRIRGNPDNLDRPYYYHSLVYLNAISPNVDPATDANEDFLQGGFGIGTVDHETVTNYAVYEEAQDLNNPHAITHWYPSLPLGNQTFYVAWNGQSAGQSWHLYCVSKFAAFRYVGIDHPGQRTVIGTLGDIPGYQRSVSSDLSRPVWVQ